MQIKYFSFRKLFLIYSMWFLGLTALQVFLLMYSAEFDLIAALKDSLLSNILIGTASFAMINVMRVYQPPAYLRVLDSIGLAILCVYSHKWLIPFLFDALPGYADFFQTTFILRCAFSWLLINMMVSNTWMWSKMQEQQEMEIRKTANEQLAREAELSKLRQQLQPHFLFNSLNSISALIGSKPEAARTMIQQLSDFLRGTLKKDDQQLVTLAQELEHLNLYLEIEKVRFGHRLQTELKTDDDAFDRKLPSLLLQPLVENAIKFGLYDTTGEILIRIISTGQDNFLNIAIENPFDPQTATPRHGTGFGLSSVQRRLYLLYGRQDLLTTSQQNTTFVTTVKIPQTL